MTSSPDRMTPYSHVHAQRVGGWYAVSFLVLGIFVLKLLWGFSWFERSSYYMIAVYIFLPYAAYRLGRITGLRVLIEGEDALLQGTACLLSCLLLGALALSAAGLLHGLISGESFFLHTTSGREIFSFVAKCLIPIAPLGVLYGASLGLLRP